MGKDEKQITAEFKWYTYPQMRNALVSGSIIGTSLLLSRFSIIPEYFTTLLYIIAGIIGGFFWAREGLEELIQEKEIGIELLMLVAAVGAGVLGLWEEAALLVFIYGAAEGLEGYTFAKTRSSIRKLLDLAPKEARLLKSGKEITVSAQELKIGDIFIVRPGESLPTDGVIVKGSSSINEAPVTGESIPVEKNPGMKVFSATINQEGVLEIKVTAIFANNTLSKMVHMVEKAQDKKGKAQVFIEKFGKKYSPIVLLVGLLLLVIPSLFGASFSIWAVRAIVFLVAAAPCALVMSTPVAVATGIGTAGKNGVLVKGGMHLENLGKTRAVAFDKTGTLTLGKPVVTDIEAVKGKKVEIIQLAASVEQYSEHPLAKAVISKAKEMNVIIKKAVEFKALTGAGAVATIEKQVIQVGKQELFTEVDQAFVSKVEKLRQDGKTVIYVGTKNTLLGAIAVRDEIRPQAKQVIEKLHKMGIKIAMLTGDNQVTAKAIGKELGIDTIKANLKPEDKIAVINELKKAHQDVVMVGDGINDAPALATATVGIAMGTAGTDAAIEAADVALMGDDISKVAYAIELGKKARNISRQNIIFSLLLLVVLIPSALIGAMTIAIAVTVHEVGELLAIGNGLRVSGSIRKGGDNHD